MAAHLHSTLERSLVFGIAAASDAALCIWMGIMQINCADQQLLTTSSTYCWYGASLFFSSPLQAVAAVLCAPVTMLQLLQQQQQAALQATKTPAGLAKSWFSEPCCSSCRLNHSPADNPTAVALSVADQLISMAAAGTTAQHKQLLHCLLQVAASSSNAATAAALAANAISSSRLPDHQDAASIHVAMVQPKLQMLLLQALDSSNRIVSTAAADMLAGLWHYIHVDDTSLAAVPGYAATMQQAAAQVLSNSRLAAPAAELCWYASTRWSGPSDLLVVHATALLGAAADVPSDFAAEQAQQQQQQQQGVRCQIFSLAALCNLASGQGLQDALAGHIAEQQLPPLLQVFLDRQMGYDDYAAAANAAMPQLVSLLQRLLHALRCSGAGSDQFEERLAGAACEVLSYIDDDLLKYLLKNLAQQLEQQQQQGSSPSNLIQQQQQQSTSPPNPIQQQQQPTAASQLHPTPQASLQPGHQLLAELLLACAPGPNFGLQHLDDASKPACANDSFIGQPVIRGYYWNTLVAVAPMQTREAIVSALLLQATSESAIAAAAPSSTVGGGSSSSSSSKPNPKAVTRVGMHSHLFEQKPRWCWGCHANANNHGQPHSSQAQSTAAAAAAGTAVSRATERLQALAVQCDKALQLPLHVLKQQHRQQQLLAAFNNAGPCQRDGDQDHNEQQQQLDKIGVQELVLLLYNHWPQLPQEQQQQQQQQQQDEQRLTAEQQQQQQHLAPKQQRVSAVLLQQLQACLAGDAAAMHLIDNLSQFTCVKDWLVQHADEVTSILAAEPWTELWMQQYLGQPQEGQQQQQVEKSVVLASQLLLQLLKHDKAGVAQRCSQLPA
jgi:hypothetical protein